MTTTAAAPRSSSMPRRQAARDLAALPSFVHSLDEFPYVEFVEPTILSWSGEDSSRRASEAKLARVLKGSKKTIATSSSEEDEPALIRRLRMTAMPDEEHPAPQTLSEMPPLISRTSTDSASSASSCPLPTPRERLVDGYFSGRSSATATPLCATPRKHRTPQASPSPSRGRRVAKKASGAIAPCAPGPARIPGSLPVQNAMPLCGPSPTSKRFTVGVDHEDDDSDRDEDSD